MPVIQLSLKNLLAWTKRRATEKEILDTLPYLGLDIEGREGEYASVEYSPNRPDFSSEAGIARALLGLLGLESGAPSYNFGQSEFKIDVENDEIRTFRPFVSGLCASIQVTDELIKQLITMQEDLTNGIGRRRSKVAIGIHNADVIKPPIRYYATKDKNFSFVPLYGTKAETINTILSETVQGRQYARLVSSGIYPMLEDSIRNVLSMPPIINGELTRLKPGIRRLFVDVTATEKHAGVGATAIMAAMLSDAGAEVETVLVGDSSGSHSTPDMSEMRMRFDLDLTNRVLGLNLSDQEAKSCLERGRLSLDSGFAVIPAFRMDVIHPIDLVEDVALGYGIHKFAPEKTESSLSGSLHPRGKKLERFIDLMVGFGFVEIYTLSLTSKQVSNLCPDQNLVLHVEDSKSENNEYLKSEILPVLLSVLGSSTHEVYPQGIFEQATVFSKSEKSEAQVLEVEHLGAAIADSAANFSAIKSILEPLIKLASGSDWHVKFEAKSANPEIFADGRVASVSMTKPNAGTIELGLVGEISPSVLETFGLRVPVAGFEIKVEPLISE